MDLLQLFVIYDSKFSGFSHLKTKESHFGLWKVCDEHFLAIHSQND